jgi:phage recombination protein Bet
MLPATRDLNTKQFDLIRRTVFKDCNTDEFDLAMHVAKHTRLDPLRRQIYAFVFNKTDEKKRQMTLVTSISGYRSIAARTGNYRPDNRAPRFTYDENVIDPQTNPTGLVSAEVSVFVHSHGQWHEVVGWARWEEYVPLKEEWVADETGQRRPSGKPAIDKGKGGWIKMPSIMLAKVAEASALRRAFPDDFAGLYTEDEVDRQATIDLSATEIADAAAQDRREDRIGGFGILVDFSTLTVRKPLIPIKPGEFHGKVDEFLEQNHEEPSTIMMWREKNNEAFKQFWAIDPNAALDLKQKFEAVERGYNAELAQPQAARAALAAAE